MTAKISISLPDDLADALSAKENVSAYIAGAVRRQLRHDRTNELLQRSGYNLTEQDIEQGARIAEEASAKMTPELIAHVEAQFAKYRRPRP